MDKIQTLKGFRDFLPVDATKREVVIKTLRRVFNVHGFEPLETPALEYADVLLGKYGEEADKLLYTFIDRGGRKIGMRYDQTVPLARVVAQYQHMLPFPFKRFQIQPVWRAENTQRGRFREFLQCDIDTIGTDSHLADAEILQVIAKAYTELGFDDFRILVNDRKLFTGIPNEAITIIDKLKKIGPEGVKKELTDKGFETSLLDEIQKKEPTQELLQILEYASAFGVPDDQLVFEPTLARGLDYYTGMIIEVEIPKYSVGSVGGGGRYDNLVGMFAGRQVPAVGFAFGFDRIIDAMNERNLFPASTQNTKVLITIFSEKQINHSLSLLSQLTEKNIAAQVYLNPSEKMEKQLKYADQKNIPFVLILGPDEINKNSVIVRDMKSREQKEIMQDALVDTLQ